jgi:hypothetical protein
MGKIIFHLTVVLAAGLIVAFMFPRRAPDTDRYLSEARALYESGTLSLDGGATPTARDAPGLPLLFWLAMKAGFKNPETPVKVLNGVCLAVIALSCSAALRFLLGNAPARVRAKAANDGIYYCGLYPAVLGTCVFVLTETIYTALFLLGHVLILASFEKGSGQKKIIWLWMTAGFVWGLSALFRPVSLLYPFAALPLAAWFMWRIKIKETRGPHFFTFKSPVFISAGLLIFALVLSPWVIRNFVVFGKLIPGAVGGGTYLYIGASREWGAEYPDFFPPDRMTAERPGLSMIQADEELGKEAKKKILSKPWEWVSLFPVKWVRFWFEVPGSKRQIQYPLLRNVLFLINILNLSLAAAGFLICLRAAGGSRTLWMAFPVLFTFAFHTVLYAMGRFRVPVEPYLCVFAVTALSFAFDAFKKPKPTGRRPRPYI